MVELGVLLATGAAGAKDETQARRLFERAAEGGNPRGVTNLAALSGGSDPTDPVKSRALLARAAEANSAEAQYQLGMMMAEGLGGPQDDVGARFWFERAAAQDHAHALERMGAFAQSGRGGAQDTAAAKAYYERAAALGDEEAKAALKRAQCPIVIKDKRGAVITHLCF
jgi:TPR repeat protein